MINSNILRVKRGCNPAKWTNYKDGFEWDKNEWFKGHWMCHVLIRKMTVACRNVRLAPGSCVCAYIYTKTHLIQSRRSLACWHPLMREVWAAVTLHVPQKHAAAAGFCPATCKYSLRPFTVAMVTLLERHTQCLANGLPEIALFNLCFALIYWRRWSSLAGRRSEFLWSRRTNAFLRRFNERSSYSATKVLILLFFSCSSWYLYYSTHSKAHLIF